MRPATLLCALAAGIACATPSAAAPESAKKAAKRVAKTMTKLKSYRVHATVEGGMARGQDHRITAARVNERYDARVAGKLAHIKGSSEAYRLRFGREGQGAVRSGARWKGILSTPEGKLIERLFQRPEVHFAKVRRYAKLARYLPPASGPSGAPAGEPVAAPEAPEDATRTAPAVDTRGRAAPSPLAVSNRIRIVAPPQEAVQQFTTVVNSGCLDGG
ncbi:MAG: hypothetical protein D6731_03780 [Planctomycetota bacterium]|nr:MAG: hypothetical protein D6731_03780 [Planctomycetota bacterium]